jgi:ATP-dependent protease HslVU (ClpYQ) peptidase subunit
MTTIAYRDRVLAADSMETDDDMKLNWKTKKVFKLPNGSLFGGAGDAESCMILLDGLKKGIELPALPKVGDSGPDVHAILVKPNGRIYFYEGYRWTKVVEKFWAIGSGRKAALALLRYGASAVDAVKGGINTDTYSGGRVRTVKLGKRKR